MEFKQVLTILRDLFMPQPRNACPHCGGIRCIGACQFNDKQPVAVEQQADFPAESRPEAVSDDPAGVQSPAVPEPGCESHVKD